jgi:pyocin large subunit-like protein
VGTARYALSTNAFTVPRPPGGEVDVPGAPGASDLVSAPVATPVEAPRPPPARVTWGHLPTLRDHFERHGPDFGSRDAEDYARQAWEFRQRAIREGWAAKRDEEGVVRIYDARSGGFAAYNRNGTTKTYFKPRSRSYFDRQPGQRFDVKTWKP